MQTIIEQMIRHVVKFEHTELSENINAFPPKDISARLLFIKMLAWIKRRCKPTRYKSMRLTDYPWERKLRRLIETDAEFKKVFRIEGDDLDFASPISLEEIAAIEGYVDENYRPTVRR
jgi:hypothetical protein